MRKITWAEFTTEHMANLDVEDSTHADVDRTLTAFAEGCHPSGPRAVNFKMLEAYTAHMKNAGNTLATRNKWLRYLRAAFNAGIEPCMIHDLRRRFCTDLARVGGESTRGPEAGGTCFIGHD